jgi:hypothetical protein
MMSDVEKPMSSPGRSRLAFLKTKRAIATLSVLVIVSIVLIGKYDTFGISFHPLSKLISRSLTRTY